MAHATSRPQSTQHHDLAIDYSQFHRHYSVLTSFTLGKFTRAFFIPLPRTEIITTPSPPPHPVSASAPLCTILAIMLAFVTAWISVQIYRIYSTRGYYLADFTRCSFEARELWMETVAVSGRVAESRRGERVMGNTGFVGREDEEVLSQADDLDTVIRLALCKWEAVLQPDDNDGEGDEERETGRVVKKGAESLTRRKRHGRFVIGLMRRKCFEGLERRRELSNELERLQRELLGRKVDVQNATSHLQGRHYPPAVPNSKAKERKIQIETDRFVQQARV